MPRGQSSLPSQIPILPLFDQAVLFPALLLRLTIKAQSSASLLSHILRSDQAPITELVVGCVPVRPGSSIAEIIGEDGRNLRPALPAPEGTQPPPDSEFGCTARIKNLSCINRSYANNEYILVVEGIFPTKFVLIIRNH
jgi:hypothetical protein